MDPLILTWAPGEGEWSIFKSRLLHFRSKIHGSPKYKIGWAPEMIWMLRRRCNSLDPARN